MSDKISKKDIGKATPTNWEFSEKEKLYLQATFILENMVVHDYSFSNILPMNLRVLENVIDFLEEKGLIQQTELPANPKKILGFTYGYDLPDWVYKPSPEGKKFIKKHKKRYLEFIRVYDVFAHVDPDEGNFAMERMAEIILEFDNATYDTYLSLDKWLDYRVPVMVFKGIDPRPLIFFSKMEDGAYRIDEKDEAYEWAERLYLDEFWDEIYQVLKNAPVWESHGFEDIGPKKIMKNIIKGGIVVLQEQHGFLRKHEKKQNAILRESEVPGESENTSKMDFPIPSDAYLEQYYRHPIRYVGTYKDSILDEKYWN